MKKKICCWGLGVGWAGVGVGKGGGGEQQAEAGGGGGGGGRGGRRRKEEEDVVVVVEKTKLPWERFLFCSAATKEERTPSLEASTLS